MTYYRNYTRKREHGSQRGNIQHSLKINHFRIILEKMLHKEKIITSKFLYNRQFNGQGLDECLLLPDAIFVIKHIAKEKSLLHFLEVDIGTEIVVPKNTSAYSFSEKLNKYIRYFDNELYKTDFNGIFKTDFNGFRLIVITISKERTKSIVNLAKQSDADFVWVTEFENISSQSFLKENWQTLRDERLCLIQNKRVGI